MPTSTVAEKDAALFAEEARLQSTHAQDIEDTRILDGFLFVPSSLRHDFKRDASNTSDAVTAARYARSARLFFHTNQHLRENLYPADVEAMIGARVYYERALVKLTEVEAKAGSMTLLQLQRQVVSLVQQCLKDGQCDIYIGLVQPKRTHLLYSACSTHSRMMGKQLLASEGVSFQSVDNQVVVVCEDVAHDPVVKCYSDHRCGPFACFPLGIRRRRDQESNPLQHATPSSDNNHVTPATTSNTSKITTSAAKESPPKLNVGSSDVIGVLAVDASRMAWKYSAAAMTVAQVAAFLVAYGLADCVATFQKHRIDGGKLLALSDVDVEFTLGIHRVASRSKVLELVGALRDGVPLHLPDPPTWFVHEPPSMAFLEEVATRASKVFARARVRDWHRKLGAVTKDGLSTQYDVYNVAIQAILHCILTVSAVSIWRVEGHRKLPPSTQVHVLGACDIPLDRIAPFVNAYDKGIKRMQLYKEHGGGKPSMLRGNITRIGSMTDRSPSSSDAVAPFIVTWSDQSTEELSWPQLQQLLPVRPLNTQHFHLQKLLTRLESQSDFVTTVDGDVPPQWLHTFFDNDADKFTYVLDLTFQPATPSPREHALYFVSQLILPTMEEALVCVRGRQRRTAARAHSMKVMRKAIAQLSMSPSSDALRSVTDLVTAIAAEVVSCLPGVEVGVAELQPGGTSVQFTFGFNGCTLAESHTTIGRGVAVSCLQPPRPVIVRSLEGESDAAGLWCFNHDQTSCLDDELLPLVFLPMVHEDSLVGLVSIRRFVDVEKGRSDELHPEWGVVPFLECAAKCLAAVLRVKRRGDALYQLEAMAHNAFVSPLHLYVATMHTMTACFVGLLKPKLVAFDKPLGHASTVLDCPFDLDSLSVQYVDALRDVRYPETLLHTFQRYFNLDDGTMQDVMDRLETPASSPVLTGHTATLCDRSLAVPIDRKLHKTIDAAFKIVFGHQVYVQSWVPALCTSTTLVALTYTTTPEWLCRSDGHFLDTLAHTLNGLLTIVQGRYDRVRERVAALAAFQVQCRLVGAVNVPLASVLAELEAEIRPDVQTWAVESIATTLTGANVYIGMVEPPAKRITYTCASSRSHMVGKHLKMGKGVSFHCIESRAPVVMIDQHDITTIGKHKLRHFGDPKAFQWPFIAVPIGTLGVLAVDNLTEYGESPAPEMGIVDFLVRMAAEIDTIVRSSRAQTLGFRAHLRDRAIHDMMIVCDNGRHSEWHVLQRLLDVVAATFSGVSAYVGLVAPWCSSMDFSLATTSSSMQGKTINMTTSVSAACFRSQHPVVVPDVTKNPNGLHCFDPTQTGVYVAVPIPYVGVLAVDTFPGPAGGKYMTNVPEPGVVACLSSLSNSVGAHIQAKRLWGLTNAIKGLFHGNSSTFAVLFNAVATLIAFALPATIRIDVWYTYANHAPEVKFSKASDVHSLALPMSASWAATYPSCTHTKATPFELNESTLVCPFEMVDPSHPYLQTHAWLVVTRLPTVQWAYDLHVLETVQPLLSECFHLSSQRAAAAVARAECLARMHMGLQDLVQTRSDVAESQLRITQDAWLNWMADALGRGTDVYLGQLQANYHPHRGDFNDLLVFTAASSDSLMHGVRLSDESLFSFQCIRTQEPVVINHLTNTSRAVRFCTARKAIRAYCALPLSTCGMIGVDSFGPTAFNVKNELEPATLHFLKQCALCHVELLETTRVAVSVAHIQAAATAVSTNMPSWHAMQCLYAQVLLAVQTNVGYVHCQQIVRLAADFTGDCTILCWHKAPTRRPMQHLPVHFCYRHHCVPTLVGDHVHLDDLMLPMTNVPRTLDDARSAGAPTTGLEPRGAFPCFAGMLDSLFVAPRVAFCLYRKPGRPFAPRDVRFLNVVMHIAQVAYVNMYKALVVRTLAAEALQWANDFVHAKEGMVVVSSSTSPLNLASPPQKPRELFTVVFATNPDKFPIGVALKKTLKRTHRLAALSATPDVQSAMVCISTSAGPAAGVNTLPVSTIPPTTPLSVTTATISTTVSSPVPPKPTGSKFTSLFSKKQAAKDHLAQITSPSLAASSAAPPRPVNSMPPVPSQHWEWACRLPATQYLLLDITTTNAVHVEQFMMEGETLADTCRLIYDAFWANPRGDEPFVGYFLTSWWHQIHVALGSARLAIEQQVRLYLDAEVVNKSSCSANAIAILSGALLCCGYKNDEFQRSKRATLQLFLAKQVASELHSLDPFNQATKSTVWTAAFRSRAFFLGQSLSPLQLALDVSPAFRSLLNATLLLQVISKWLKADADKEKAVWTPLILAATRIQCRARCRMAVAEVSRRRRTYHATLVLQCFVRQTLARWHVQARREGRAASRIQRWYRRRHEKKPAFATKALLVHMRAVQARFGLNEVGTDGAEFGEAATFEQFLHHGGGKGMVHAEAKRLLQKLKDMAKGRASLPWEARVDEEVRDVFEYFDYAGVGSISRDDAKTMMQKLRIPLQVDELNDVVDMMDSDKSGDVDVAEFCSWYKYEYARLRARSKDCGTLSNTDKEWFTQGMAMRFVRQRWTVWRNKARLPEDAVAPPPVQSPPVAAPPTTPPQDDNEGDDNDDDSDDDASSGDEKEDLSNEEET